MEVRRAQLTVVVQLLDDAEELVGDAREAGGHVIGSAPAPRHRDARTTWTGLSPGHVSAPTTLNWTHGKVPAARGKQDGKYLKPGKRSRAKKGSVRGRRPSLGLCQAAGWEYPHITDNDIANILNVSFC